VAAPIDGFASARGCAARVVTDFLSFRNSQEKQGGIAFGMPTRRSVARVGMAPTRPALDVKEAVAKLREEPLLEVSEMRRDRFA
jgi:hypothetical protein